LPFENLEVRLVVFDWGGTTVDHGCFAPAEALAAALARRGVPISPAEARGPMGLGKKDHVRALLRAPEVAERWGRRHGRPPAEADVEAVYADLAPLLLEMIDRHGALIPGVPECVAELRRRGLRVGGTTGYFRAAAARAAECARRQGFVPDCSVCADDVPAGRPTPWMLFRNMEALGVYPPAAVVKVGDTVPDVEEGRNAGAWSVGVSRSGNEVGRTEAELSALPAAERQALLGAARAKLLAAGAHAVLETVAELPGLIDGINSRLRAGERP
jgi:phosphonoacetaldehyde hydrolase